MIYNLRWAQVPLRPRKNRLRIMFIFNRGQYVVELNAFIKL